MTLSDEGKPEPDKDAAPPPTEKPTADDRPLTEDLDEVERGRPERAFNVGATLGVVTTVAAVIFVMQNRRTTSFDWLWLDFELPLWVALVGSIAAGIVLTLTALAIHGRRQRRIGRRQEAVGRLRRALGSRARGIRVPGSADDAVGDVGDQRGGA